MTPTKKQPERKTPTKKRLVRGRDWHAWAWKYDCGGFFWSAAPRRQFGYTLPRQPAYWKMPADSRGRWVRVKFVEVKT